MLLAIFGIDNTGLSLGITFVILALVAIWIALIVFTFSDARRRISDPFLVGCATAASLFPFVGTVVYTILRPPEYLDDIQERETEMKAAETRMRHLNASSCRKCGFPAEPDFIRCPACRTRLREPCPSCSRPVGLKWRVCAYCEHTLIESKRSTGPVRSTSRSSSGDGGSTEGDRSSGKPARSSAKSAPSRSGRAPRKPPAKQERSARADSAASSGSRQRSKSGDQAARTNREGTSEGSVRADRDETSERPARSATRSDRRRVVVSDEDLPGGTINGGDSKPEEGRADDA
jgi:hypothetical protein